MKMSRYCASRGIGRLLCVCVCCQLATAITPVDCSAACAAGKSPHVSNFLQLQYHSCSCSDSYRVDMISSSITSSVLLLFICVSLSQLGTSGAACQDNPKDCLSCAQCNGVRRPIDNNIVYMWVNDNATSAVPGNGTCVHFYDPPGSLNKADIGSSNLCGKLVFLLSPVSATSALSVSASLAVAFMLVV
jgi:hypothetical protein